MKKILIVLWSTALWAVSCKKKKLPYTIPIRSWNLKIVVFLILTMRIM